MKKKLDPLNSYGAITKSEASYEKLMLEMMSKLVTEIRVSNHIAKQSPSKKMHVQSQLQVTGINYKKRQVEQFIEQHENDHDHQGTIQQQHEVRSYERINGEKHKKLSQSNEQAKKEVQQPNVQRLLISLQKRLQASEALNRKLLQRLESHDNLDRLALTKRQSSTMNNEKLSQKFIQKVIKGQGTSNQKNSYNILSQILPHSDRREIKVKFRLEDVVDKNNFQGNTDLRSQTSEWLGMVYRATASICWNMLLNNYLSFDQVKILFTENIIFNFISLMSELNELGYAGERQELTSLINVKSIDILDFLCKQYPQTKNQAPNMALRQILPPIENQGKVKYDLISKSGMKIVHRADGDYTSEIMKVINFMIEQSNQQYDQFSNYMKGVFDLVYSPINKRQKVNQGNNQELEDSDYKQKVKSYTKYLIGRKISKNTSKYSEEQIEDGIFFVKSSGVLRIITKWVQQLMEYIENPEASIKNSYSQKKDHNGNPMHLDTFVKNAIYKQTIKGKKVFMSKLEAIKHECFKMQLLLTNQEFIEDSTQMHLSQEQIKVGMFCSNLKSAISSYICVQLNEAIHYLLSVPKDVNLQEYVPEQNAETVAFLTQKKKDLDNINFISFKIFDLLRCKIHSNEQEIIWLVKHLLKESENDKDKFNIVRIKDRLHLGTRDIMINAQINKGLVCEIQISVTSQSDKKQELLDSYNHFLYELKRSNLGPLTQNVSIWSNLQQRHSYFELLRKKKMKQQSRSQKKIHKCGNDNFETFKRPIICLCCNIFFAIPRTCLLNVLCKTCGETICGQCYYYNYSNSFQRKTYIFDNNKFFKNDVLQKLKQYTDYQNSPLPQSGFFIKKNFLKKELSFYMAVQKDKVEGVKDNPNMEILVVQTVIRGNQIINRQLNKKQVNARLENGQFFVKKYQKTQLNNYIIFYFDKQHKKLMKLADLEKQLKSEQHKNTRVLNIIRQPSYISYLKVIKKEKEKIRQMNSLQTLVGDKKIVVYKFKNLFLLAQVVINGKQLRSQIVKRLNISDLKKFVNQKSDVISIEDKKLTNEFDQLPSKLKPIIYSNFAKNIKKLFLANNLISSIKIFSNFTGVQLLVISNNNLDSLQGLQELNLTYIKFDNNNVSSLEPLRNTSMLRSIYGSSNKLVSLQPLSNKKVLKCISVYGNQIQSLKPLENSTSLFELYLRDNHIEDIQIISSLTNLTKVFIDKTMTKNMPNLSSLKTLKTLSIQSNNLTEIPDIFKGLELHQLFLGDNKIKSINSNLKSQTELLRLNLTKNQIEKIQNLETLTSLQVLKMPHNKITVVSGIKNLDNLKLLNLKKNPIEDLGELFTFEITFAYEFSEDMISEQAKLQLIQLKSNKDDGISQGQD